MGNRHRIPVIACCILGCFLHETSGKRIPQFAGPYTITLRRVGNETEDYNSTGLFWTKVRFSHPKPKQKQFAWGEVYTSVELSNDMKIQVTMAQRSNNQWKPNAFVMKFDNACATLLFHARELIKLWYGNLNTCPLPKFGYRVITNRTFDMVFPQFPVFPYGHWLFTLAIMKGSEAVGVGVADGDTVPKL